MLRSSSEANSWRCACFNSQVHKSRFMSFLFFLLLLQLNVIRSLNLVFDALHLQVLASKNKTKKYYVLIFSHVSRRYKITSEEKVATFACTLFTETYCISVISKVLNGVNSFKRFCLNVFFRVKRILVSYLQH